MPIASPRIEIELSASVSRLRLASVIQTSLDGLRMAHARLIYPAGIQSFLDEKSATLRRLHSAACRGMDGVAIPRWREEQRRMAFHLTTEGVIAEITPENQGQKDQRAIRTRDE